MKCKPDKSVAHNASANYAPPTAPTPLSHFPFPNSHAHTHRVESVNKFWEHFPKQKQKLKRPSWQPFLARKFSPADWCAGQLQCSGLVGNCGKTAGEMGGKWVVMGLESFTDQSDIFCRCSSRLLAALTEPTNMFGTLFTLASGWIRFSHSFPFFSPCPFGCILVFHIQSVFSAFICCSSEIKSKKYALAFVCKQNWEHLNFWTKK